jgi:hypothetical protein
MAVARSALAAASFTGVVSPFLSYTGFGTRCGIFSATPQDKLHHFQGGLAKMTFVYILRALHECDDLLCTRAEALGTWTKRLVNIEAFANPEHGTRFRRFSGNILEASTLSSKDALALLFQMKYAVGETPDVFPPHIHNGILRTLLAFEDLYLLLSETSMWTDTQLGVLEDRAARYNDCLHRTFGTGSKFGFNLKKPKIHALIRLVAWIRLFGAWGNWCTGHFEQGHKTRTKDHASKTNNRQ